MGHSVCWGVWHSGTPRRLYPRALLGSPARRLHRTLVRMKLPASGLGASARSRPLGQLRVLSFLHLLFLKNEQLKMIAVPQRRVLRGSLCFHADPVSGRIGACESMPAFKTPSRVHVLPRSWSPDGLWYHSARTPCVRGPPATVPTLARKALGPQQGLHSAQGPWLFTPTTQSPDFCPGQPQSGLSSCFLNAFELG